MDEGIAMMRAVWTEDPVTFRSKHIPAEITEMSMRHCRCPIPIWFGARSEAAYKRTVRIGDGWHGSQLDPEEAAPIIARLRRDRPEPEFTIRCAPIGTARTRANCARYRAAYAETASSTSWSLRSTARSMIGTRSSKAPAASPRELRLVANRGRSARHRRYHLSA